MDAETVVVGAGPSGLAAGIALAQAGREVAVLEGSDAPGGLLRCERDGGYSFAWGPQSFLGRAESMAWLCAAAGCEDLLVPARAASRRFVWRRGRLHELPSGPGSYLRSSLLSWRAKLRAPLEPFVRAPREPGDEESVRSFFGRRLGAEATDALVVPFVSGVHAGDADRLEARSAFPAAWRWEREQGSLLRGAWASRRSQGSRPARKGLWSLRGGLQSLADGAARALGARLRCRTPVDRVEASGAGWRIHGGGGDVTCRNLVLAVPPPAAARLLGSEHAASVSMASVAVVHLGGPVAGPRPDGFGVLLHREEGSQALGIVFSAGLFEDVAPPGEWLQATYVGGRMHPHALDASDEDLCALARDTSRRVLRFDPDGGVRRVVRHPAGIQQLEAGHARRIAALREDCARRPGLALAGSWLDGIGLEAAAAAGRSAADQVLRRTA